MNPYCHLESVEVDDRGEVVWALGRPACGAVDAERCVAPGIHDGSMPLDGDACASCGRPRCPACAEHHNTRVAENEEEQ